jgi:DNA-binding CsgD family transcriptional regulator
MRRVPPGKLAARPGMKLSDRELEALSLLAEGATHKEIARDWGISHRTVEIHTTRVRIKLGAKTAAHAVAIGVREKII